jgi:hypothetical protein
LFGREGLDHEDRGEALDRSQDEPLHQAEENQHVDVDSQTTPDRGQHKTDHDGDKQVAVPKEAPEPAEHRDHQGASDQKRRGHPLGGGQVGAKSRHHPGDRQVDAVASKGLRGAG